jgi:autotransporter family porin
MDVAQTPRSRTSRRALVLAGTIAVVAAAVAGYLAVSRVTDDAAGVAPIRATTKAVRVPATPAHFGTLPVGAALPSDASCAGRVRRNGVEVRPSNARFNATTGGPTSPSADPNYPRYGRVTGNFTGTTDEIIQWAACKWGIDEDIVRAQAAKETYWFQRNVGDFSSDPSRCVPGHPIGFDGRPGECPESIGIMQIRYPYFRTTITHAITSTAYNLDLAYAVWRTCFEGEERWLNDVDRGAQYAAGDAWGCVGRWFAGRWRTQPALEYIAAVQGYLRDRIWETGGFINYT